MPRAFQRMLSGRRLDLLDPAPLDIEIADIAHGLSFVARWNGQTSGDWPFSVAEHSLLVVDLMGEAPPRWRMAALLHDAPEYVIGDLIGPVKSAVTGYGALEARLTEAIHLRFGLPATLPRDWRRAIKRADRASAWLEATQLAGFSEAEATRLFGAPPPERAIVPLEPRAARAAFLGRFAALEADREGPGGATTGRSGPFRAAR